MHTSQIKSIREAIGISRTELAERMGVTWHTIMRYEKDEISISLDRLRDVARALGVPLTCLISIHPDDLGPSTIEVIEETPNLMRFKYLGWCMFAGIFQRGDILTAEIGAAPAHEDMVVAKIFDRLYPRKFVAPNIISDRPQHVVLTAIRLGDATFDARIHAVVRHTNINRTENNSG